MSDNTIDFNAYKHQRRETSREVIKQNLSAAGGHADPASALSMEIWFMMLRFSSTNDNNKQ